MDLFWFDSLHFVLQDELHLKNTLIIFRVHSNTITIYILKILFSVILLAGTGRQLTLLSAKRSLGFSLFKLITSDSIKFNKILVS